jgi:hypothetical protein
MIGKPPPSYRAIKRSMNDDEIIAAYLAGDDPEDIGYRAGLHAQTVRKILHTGGVTFRPPRRGRRSAPVLDELEVCRRYRAGESGVALAATLGTSAARIYGILQRHDVPRRSPKVMLRQRHQAERQRRAPGDG